MIETIINEMSNFNFWKSIIQDIISSLISGITIGATLALIGYFVWKKQNLYSKKFDAYINVISSIHEVYSVITHSIFFKNDSNFNQFFEFDKSLFLELKKNKVLFISYFGNEYNDKIEYFININKHLERVQITMKKGTSVYTQVYKPEEYTKEIVNFHKQQVIDTMHEYIVDLELVSKDLKKYALFR